MAPSICRRLLIHAFFWAVVRALTKFGTAIAANRPMIATTIMISTNVNPLARAVLFFILDLSFVYGVNTAMGGLLLVQRVLTNCPWFTVSANLAGIFIKSIRNITFSYPFLTRQSRSDA